MSDKTRDITIENSAFNLTIHYNPDVVGTQVGILVLCILGICFVDVPAIHTLAWLLIIGDVVSVFLGLFVLDKKGKKEDKPKETKKARAKDKSSNKSKVSKDTGKATESNPQPRKYTRSVHTDENENIAFDNMLQLARPKPKAEQGQRIEDVPVPQENDDVLPPVEEEVPVIPDTVRDAFADFFSVDDDDF